MLRTKLTTHGPSARYTATIALTGTKEEISELYYMLKQIDGRTATECRILNDILEEMRTAYNYLEDMEDIESSYEQRRSNVFL